MQLDVMESRLQGQGESGTVQEKLNVYKVLDTMTINRKKKDMDDLSRLRLRFWQRDLTAVICLVGIMCNAFCSEESNWYKDCCSCISRRSADNVRTE